MCLEWIILLILFFIDTASQLLKIRFFSWRASDHYYSPYKQQAALKGCLFKNIVDARSLRDRASLVDKTRLHYLLKGLNF